MAIALALALVVGLASALALALALTLALSLALSITLVLAAMAAAGGRWGAAGGAQRWSSDTLDRGTVREPSEYTGREPRSMLPVGGSKHFILPRWFDQQGD